MKRLHAIPLIAIGACTAAGLAFGQVDNPPHSNIANPETPHHDTQMAMSSTSDMSASMHDMPGTVTAVDHKTGIVDVESENMKLKVHFPTNTIADLKKGDKIQLHLGFSKQ